MHCARCDLTLEGNLRLPLLARLDPTDQQLAERILLAGGNLKQVAGDLGISYPTLRKRVDSLIGALAGLKEADERNCQGLLDQVEAGRLSPEEASRQIKEMKGAL